MDNLSPIPHCFLRVPGSDRITLTRSGRERFQQRFAQVGVNIDDVKTVKDFLRVHTLCLQHDLRACLRDRSLEPAIKQLLTRLDPSLD